MDDRRQYVAVGLLSGGVAVYSLQLQLAGEGRARGASSNDDTVSCSSYGAGSSVRGGRPGSASPAAAGMRSKPQPKETFHSSSSSRLTASLTQRVYRKDSQQEISDIKFDSGGNVLAAGSHDRHIYLYRMEGSNGGRGVSSGCNLRLLHKLRGHNSYVTHLDWSNDNRMIRSTCGAYELLFWDTGTGRQITSTSMNESWRTHTCVLGFNVMCIWPAYSDGTDVNALDVCRESNIMATADDFGTMKLFNYPCIVKHAPGRTYIGHSSHVTNVRFFNGSSNETSTYLATTGGNDSTLFTWRVKPVR